MTKRKTTLIQKKTPKGHPDNYRPIMCLLMVWKIQTAHIRKEIYDSLISDGLFPEKQKRCSKTRQKKIYLWHGLTKKAYDMVLQRCLKIYKISCEVNKFIKNAMEKWRGKLVVREKSLTEVKIQRGIFQGEVLSPLLCVIAMESLSHIFKNVQANISTINRRKNQPPHVHGWHPIVCKKN